MTPRIDTSDLYMHVHTHTHKHNAKKKSMSFLNTTLHYWVEHADEYMLQHVGILWQRQAKTVSNNCLVGSHYTEVKGDKKEKS